MPCFLVSPLRTYSKEGMFRRSTSRGMPEGKGGSPVGVIEILGKGPGQPTRSARSRYSLMVVLPAPQLAGAVSPTDRCRGNGKPKKTRIGGGVFLLDNDWMLS